MKQKNKVQSVHVNNKYTCQKSNASTVNAISPMIDILLSPFILMASLLVFGIRKMRVSKMPVSKRILKTVGVFPRSDHFYEPCSMIAISSYR